MSNLTIPKVSEETTVKNCVDCYAEFTLPKWGMASYEIRCQKCLKAKEEAEEAKAKEAVQLSWRPRCPTQFLETDPGRLPCQESTKRALDWKSGPIGLLLHGPTGTGKTRTAWLALKNQHFTGKHFKVLNSLAGLEYAAKFSESAAVVEKWVSEMVNADILFMDDVFKNKFTDSFEGVIFSIVDRRTERGLPIILTANDTGATLTSRLSEDRGEPLVRRLREFCLSLKFNLKD